MGRLVAVALVALSAALPGLGTARADPPAPTVPPSDDKGDDKGDDSDDSKPFTASEVDGWLRGMLQGSAALTITLSEHPTRSGDSESVGEDCVDFQRVRRAALRGTGARGMERGKLGGLRAFVELDGPHGSGHFWDVRIAVRVRERVLGACVTTTTTGWRNLGVLGPVFPMWRTLDRDRLVLWSSFEMRGGLYYSLLYPVAYRLVDDELVWDEEETRRLVGEMAQGYARAAKRRPPKVLGDDLGAHQLHAAAAEAYRAIAKAPMCAPKSAGAATSTSGPTTATATATAPAAARTVTARVVQSYVDRDDATVVTLDRGKRAGLRVGSRGHLLCGRGAPPGATQPDREFVVDEVEASDEIEESRARAPGLAHLLCCLGARIVFDLDAPPAPSADPGLAPPR